MAITNEKIEQMLASIQELKAAKEQEIEELRVKWLGKKGEITQLFDEFRTVDKEQKREFGQRLNALKNAATAKIEEMRNLLSEMASPA
ncbi:MAG: phenylalanine--tRNA ligase subunit alpha, partial [Bacteroidales bacterium]|nr:phenylalanine--tRNA ligase subunit alpha [Bacteroidales bacterium]